MVKPATPGSPLASGTGTNEAQVSLCPSSGADKRREGTREIERETLTENGEVEGKHDKKGEKDEGEARNEKIINTKRTKREKCDRKEKRERHEIKKNNIKRCRKHEKVENAGGRETLEMKETMKFTDARKSRFVK